MPRLRLILFAVLGIAVGGLIYWRFVLVPKSEPAAMLAAVQRLNQLTTVRYTVQRIVTLTEEKHPLGSESIVLIVQARVEAGVDLASLGPTDMVSGKDGTVTISLPPSKILNVAIDESETKVWDRQKTWWTPWVPYSLDLEKRARIMGLDAAKESAIQMGILAASQSNAETSVRSLLTLAGVKMIVVRPAS